MMRLWWRKGHARAAREQQCYLVAPKAVCVIVVLDAEGHNGACTAEHVPGQHPQSLTQCTTGAADSFGWV